MCNLTGSVGLDGLAICWWIRKQQQHLSYVIDIHVFIYGVPFLVQIPGDAVKNTTVGVFSERLNTEYLPNLPR